MAAAEVASRVSCSHITTNKATRAIVCALRLYKDLTHVRRL